MFKHQDYLYVVKENSIWSVTQQTDAAGTIVIELVDSSRGCSSHFTIDSVDNDIFFFNDKGAYAFGYEPNIQTQIRTNIVSLRVDPYIKSIQKSRLDDVSCIYFDNHYFMAYTSGGGTFNDKVLVYDRQRMGWWIFDNISAGCWTEYKDTDGNSRLYYGSDMDGTVHYLDETAKSDNGVAIASQWKSKVFEFGDYAQKKFFLTSKLYFGKMAGLIDINVYIDGTLAKTKPSNKLGTSSSGGMGTGTLGVEKLGGRGNANVIVDIGGGDFIPIPINKMGRNIQFEIIDSQLAKGWELNALEVILKPLNKIF